MPLWKSLPDGQMEESVQLAPQTKMSFIIMIENGLLTISDQVRKYWCLWLFWLNHKHKTTVRFKEKIDSMI